MGGRGGMTVRSWRDLAACRDIVSADYDPFFADSAGLQAEAIAICATCPVRDACLTFAVRTGQHYGIWGGQPEQVIRRLIAADRAGRPQARRVPASHPQASKTQCKRGHRFSAETPTTPRTAYTPDGHRRCRTCLREAQPVRASEGGGSDVA
jgi:WhiB family transcriptional regulator, redox-sensing transcriptional regulator